jgi:hypothetical protein
MEINFKAGQLIDIYQLFEHRGKTESCFLVTAEVIDFSDLAVKFKYYSNYWSDDREMWLANSCLKLLNPKLSKNDTDNLAVHIPEFLVNSNRLNYTEDFAWGMAPYEWGVQMNTRINI